MFRFVALLAAIVGAAAFAPVSRVSTRSALRMGYENELGVSEPLGYFDPLSLARDVDQETFDFCTFLQHPVRSTELDVSHRPLSPPLAPSGHPDRAAELKHGRVSMLAVFGYIATETFKFPGDIAPGISFESIPSGLAAIEAVPALGWAQIIALIGYVDFQFTTYGA